MATVEATEGSRASSWFQDERYRAIFYQILTVVGVVGLGWFVIHNTLANMAAKNLAFGFDFLNSQAGFDISFKLAEYNVHASTYWDTFWIGLYNTLLVSAMGIVTATILGFIVGVLRLSNNWIVNRLAYCYIEAVRNVPLLLQILIWASVFLYLPGIKDSYSIGGAFFLNQRGIELPTPVPGGSFWLTWTSLLIGIVVSLVIKSWSRKRQEKTGQTFPVGLTDLGLIVGLPVVVFLVTGMPLDFVLPEISGFNFQGGINIPPSLLALWFALTIYTGAFIAENVRSGIEAVSHGQTEAAYSLGLRPGKTLRLVVIPQAMRVIIPPLTSQYLNLTKNSSLGVAIAYPELVSVFAGTTLNQTGHAVEVLGITMLIYLFISLSISAFMNWYNKRIALVER